MKTTILLLAMLLAGAAPAWAGEDEDRKAIEQAVGYYFTAGDTGDADMLAKAFHPEAKMIFYREGKLTQVTQPEWQDRLRKATKPPTKANWRKIVSVDISGDAAVAKAVSDFETFQFIDYMSLIKIDGEWKIVNKIFHKKDK
jgi:hypothetical protein